MSVWCVWTGSELELQQTVRLYITVLMQGNTVHCTPRTPRLTLTYTETRYVHHVHWDVLHTSHITYIETYTDDVLHTSRTLRRTLTYTMTYYVHHVHWDVHSRTLWSTTYITYTETYTHVHYWRTTYITYTETYTETYTYCFPATRCWHWTKPYSYIAELLVWITRNWKR